jgi:hypothetical protein
MEKEPYWIFLLQVMLWVFSHYIRKWVNGTDARYKNHEHEAGSSLSYSNPLLKADSLCSSSMKLKYACYCDCHMLCHSWHITGHNQ